MFAFHALLISFSSFVPSPVVCLRESERVTICCLQVSKEELAKLVQGFDEQDILTSSGVTLAGNRYIYLSGTDRVIRAKLGKVGVHCMKTTQAVVVSLYEDPIQPQQAASVVEKLGDYLVSCGY